MFSTMNFIDKYTIVMLISSIFYQVFDATSSKDAAEKLLERYNNVIKVCNDTNGNARPAFECSGILIRGVSQEQKLPHAWSMKPLNIEKQSFSVAFLRKDQPFSEFPHDCASGFVIYPHLMTPERKSKFKLLCAFPLNAGSDYRSDRGCGLHFRDETGTSQPCDEQGIDSFEKWVKYVKKIKPVHGHKRLEVKQCSFNLTDTAAVQNFEICLEAGVYLHPDYPFQNNEAKVRSWELEKVEKLPIEVFFYIMDSENGLESAKKYRDDYRDQSNGEMVPIVGIRLPSARDEKLYVEPYVD